MLLQAIKNVIRPIPLLVLFAITHDHLSNAVGDNEVTLSLKAGTQKIEYRHSAQHWENIQGKLLENVSDPVTEICARGTWLFYEDPHLSNANMARSGGVTLHTSDAEQCFSPDELGHNLSSAQHVTAYNRRKTNTITFFQYENFIGRAMVVNRAIKHPDDEPAYYTSINSLITVGKKEWIVIMEGPARFCFSPPQNMTLPVCLLTHLVDDDKFIDVGVLQVNQAREPCAQGSARAKHVEMEVIEMTNCFESAQGVVHIKPTWPFGPPPGYNETETGGSGPNCEGSAEVLKDEHIELIAGRLNGSLGNGEWFSAIKDPKQIWKTELFDKCFQVFTKICPDSVIDDEYLLMFASLYFYHMGKVWDSGKFLNVSIPEVEWMEILHDMNSCATTVKGGDYDGIAAETATEMRTYTSLDDITGKLETMLGYRPDNDHVMEINWLMANLVASICTKARGFDANFLPRFLNIFHVLYFTPIEEQWTTPGSYSTVYKYLFGGYGMHKSLTKIALCTYNAMKFSGVTESYKRPMEQSDKILLPNVLQR